MDWTFRDDMPIYSQLVEKLEREIVSGNLAPGEKLISVRDFALEAGVNPNTMQRALSELEDEQLVLTQRTAGRFVTEDTNIIAKTRDRLSKNLVHDFIGSMRALGYDDDEILHSITISKEDNE